MIMPCHGIRLELVVYAGKAGRDQRQQSEIFEVEIQ